MRAVWQAISGGLWRENPGRIVLAVLGIALGVALGTAVHLINASAANDFGMAVRRIAGDADLVIKGSRAGFPETVYPRIARMPEVRAASPAIEVSVAVGGSADAMRLLGLDPLRALPLQPALMHAIGRDAIRLLEGDAVVLSHAAAERHGLRAGDDWIFQVGLNKTSFKIIGILSPEVFRDAVAISDIATVQWRLERTGRLHRIDVQLQPGVDVSAFARRLKQEYLPPGVDVATPGAEAGRAEALSRAYRVNLNMLSLVALLTGAFLVFATQVVAVLRRRTQFALLRALGITRAQLTGLLVAEGALIGAIGAMLGTAAGTLLAATMLKRIGGDLGAGYFPAIKPALHLDPAGLALFAFLGVVFAVAGALFPALEAGRSPPARALRAGDENAALAIYGSLPVGLVLLLCGCGLLLVPPMDGLPVAAYVSIACLVTGTVMLMPATTALVLQQLPLPDHPGLALALAQLCAAPRLAAISVAAIVASFSLMVAMLIMVASFRTSLDTWLEHMLPADLYLRATRAGDSGFLNAANQSVIAGVPGIREVQFVRIQTLHLRADRVPVTLIARPVHPDHAAAVLPMVAEAAAGSIANHPPVWISEVAAQLLGWKPGTVVELPLADRSIRVGIAGVWRDYVRQNGAVVLDHAQYVLLTGDGLVNEAALRVEPGIAPADAALRLRGALPSEARIEIAGNREIRDRSLAAFDRTFAITYALEIIAVIIGVFGVSTGFSARILARGREFAVLRYLGMTAQEIRAMLAYEAALIVLIGIAAGALLGGAIGWILIHVVNWQSFHWSMDLQLPWTTVAGLGACLIAAAVLAVAISARHAAGVSAVMAVRDDW